MEAIGRILCKMLRGGINYELTCGNTARAHTLSKALARVLEQYGIDEQ
jgi:hypothetical protein